MVSTFGFEVVLQVEAYSGSEPRRRQAREAEGILLIGVEIDGPEIDDVASAARPPARFAIACRQIRPPSGCILSRAAGVAGVASVAGVVASIETE